MILITSVHQKNVKRLFWDIRYKKITISQNEIHFFIVNVYTRFIVYRQTHPGPIDFYSFGLWVRNGGIELDSMLRGFARPRGRGNGANRGRGHEHEPEVVAEISGRISFFTIFSFLFFSHFVLVII